MFRNASKILATSLVSISLLMSGGVYATWRYAKEPADSVDNTVDVNVWDADYPALRNALIKFLEILNNVTDPNDYKTLCDIFGTGASASSWGTDGSYTGNVTGSPQAKNVETLFDNELNMKVYDQDIKVSVLLKRENLDGNENTGVRYLHKDSWWGSDDYRSGADMVMYYTADNLKTAGKTDTKVFASVFSVKANGNSETPAEGYKWQLLATYEGTATTTNWNGTNGTGSFDTRTWRSLAKDSYTRYDNQVNNPITGQQELSYLVQNEQTAQEVLQSILNS